MDDIRQTLNTLNRAWQDRKFDVLRDLLDENIVMKGPGLKELTRGREAAVQSYIDFMAQSKVVAYSETNHAVDVWDSTAVVTYDWTMSYEQKGKVSKENGHDMFVFIRAGSDWRAVLRLILF